MRILQIKPHVIFLKILSCQDQTIGLEQIVVSNNHKNGFYMKILSLINVLLLTSALAACGGTSNEGGDGGDTGSSSGGDTGTTDGGDTGNSNGGDTGAADGGDTGSSDGGDTGAADGGDTGSSDGGDTGATDGGDDGNTDGGNTGGNPPTPVSGENTVPSITCDTVFSSASALEEALEDTLPAGTNLCLANDNYSGLELNITGAGTEDAPVTIAAENPGMAIITGDSSVRMSGEYVVLQGFVFRDGTTDGDFLQTRGSGNVHCNNCRVVENSIIDINVGSEDSGRWLKIYGENNRVDHNWFSGKTTRATLIEVVRENDVANRALNTRIDYNYFGDRPPVDNKAYAESSDNEFEAIRIGFSGTHELDSFTVVEYNYFERIDAEAEVISNKSGSSTIRYNTIRDSYGSLTTRHGENALIDSNFIIGDDHPFAGGIRVVDSDHTITNNYIQGARYIDTPWQGGIILHKSEGSTVNGYQDVENVLVAHNTIVDSVNSLNVAGGNRSVLPTDVYVVNNIIADAIGPVIVRADDGLPAGSSTFAGNTFFGQSFSDNDNLTEAAGITFENTALIADSIGILRPVDSTNLDAVTDADIANFSLPSEDFDGQAREGTTQRGADHISTADATRRVLSASDVGPLNYRPEPGRQHVERIPLVNHDFDDDANGWTLLDASISNDSSEVFSRGSSVKIEQASGEVSQDIMLDANTQYTLSAFTRGDAELGVRIGSETITRGNSSSAYRFNQLAFNSGDSGLVTLFARPDQTATIAAPVLDGDFVDFRAGEATWVSVEGDGIGDVGSSSNSASGGDGSARLRYRDESHANGSPGISQTVDGLFADTNYTFSVHVRRDSDASVLLNVNLQGNETLIADNISVDYSQLDEDTEADDSFRRYDFTFNSEGNTAVEIIFNMAPQAIDLGGAAAELDGNGFYTGETQRLNEIRVDDVSLTFETEASGESEVFVDSFRLVKHGND